MYINNYKSTFWDPVNTNGYITVGLIAASTTVVCLMLQMSRPAAGSVKQMIVMMFWLSLGLCAPVVYIAKAGSSIANGSIPSMGFGLGVMFLSLMSFCIVLTVIANFLTWTSPSTKKALVLDNGSAQLHDLAAPLVSTE